MQMRWRVYPGTFVTWQICSAEALPPLPHLSEWIFIWCSVSKPPASFTSLLHVADVTRWAQDNVSLTNKSYLWAGWLVLAAAETSPASQEALCFAPTVATVQHLGCYKHQCDPCFKATWSLGVITGCGPNRRPFKMAYEGCVRGLYSYWYLVFMCLCFTSF